MIAMDAGLAGLEVSDARAGFERPSAAIIECRLYGRQGLRPRALYRLRATAVVWSRPPFLRLSIRRCSPSEQRNRTRIPSGR